MHHILLTALLAPLLVEALKLCLARGLTASTLVAALTYWLWHAPPLYAAALSSDIVHWLMQASLLGSAMCLWAAVRGASVLAGIAALMATTVQMGLLGALLTFSASPFYAPHLLGTAAWGLSPLEDQQPAGLIMWAPGAGLYLVAALAIATFAFWTSVLSRRAAQLIDGEPRVLIRHGELLDENLKRDRLTREEIESEMRLAGIARIADVEWAILEPVGKVSFIRRDEQSIAPRTPLACPPWGARSRILAVPRAGRGATHCYIDRRSDFLRIAGRKPRPQPRPPRPLEANAGRVRSAPTPADEGDGDERQLTGSIGHSPSRNDSD